MVSDMQASTLNVSFSVEAHGGAKSIPASLKAALYWTGFGFSIACTAYVFTNIGVTEGLQTMLAPVLSFAFFGRKFLR